MSEDIKIYIEFDEKKGFRKCSHKKGLNRPSAIKKGTYHDMLFFDNGEVKKVSFNNVKLEDIKSICKKLDQNWSDLGLNEKVFLGKRLHNSIVALIQKKVMRGTDQRKLLAEFQFAMRALKNKIHVSMVEDWEYGDRTHDTLSFSEIIKLVNIEAVENIKVIRDSAHPAFRSFFMRAL